MAGRRTAGTIVDVVAKKVPSTVVAKAPLPLLQPVGVVTGIVDAWREYKRVCEVEATKRYEIQAKKEVFLADLSARMEILRYALDHAYAERSENYDRFFQLLEQGRAAGDDKIIEAAVTMIVEQTRVSPMAHATQVLAQMTDPRVERLEI